MSDIDDLLGGIHDKSRVSDRARMSGRAVLVSLPEGEDGDGNWVVTWHGMTRGDLAYAIAVLQAEFTNAYNGEEANDDDA